MQSLSVFKNSTIVRAFINLWRGRATARGLLEIGPLELSERELLAELQHGRA